MEASNEFLEILAELIVKNLQEEFAIKHLSKNLINTIQISKMNGEIKIDIPAKTYNMLTYLKSGVVVHTSHGSYASKLDEVGSTFMIYNRKGRTRKGSFRTKPGNHQGYIDRVISKSIREYRKVATSKYQVLKVEE